MHQLFFKQRDIAPLAIFRIGMGLLMAAEGFGAIITGWVKRNYVEPEFTFNFIGLDFLQILVGPQAYVVYALLGVLGLMVAAGYRYRLAIVAYTILWAAVYFGQKTSYNNHYYLLLLFSFIMCFLPMHRYLSLDVKSGLCKSTSTTPNYSILSIKILLLIVYVFAALAKIYPDWLNGKAVKILINSPGLPIEAVNRLFTKDWFIQFIAYSGIAFDLLIIPALWWRKTRKMAFVLAIFFHIFNSVVFQIGIFPYMMLLCSVLFFDEKWVRKFFIKHKPSINYPTQPTVKKGANSQLIMAFFGVFFMAMMVLPLYHWVIPGNVFWTEEGHKHAWRMMLRSKSGSAWFLIKSAKHNISESIWPNNRMSSKAANKLASHPDMIWQFAQRLKKEYHIKGINDVEIYAYTSVSLNGSAYASIVDHTVNLAQEPWLFFKHNHWIHINPNNN